MLKRLLLTLKFVAGILFMVPCFVIWIFTGRNWAWELIEDWGNEVNN